MLCWCWFTKKNYPLCAEPLRVSHFRWASNSLRERCALTQHSHVLCKKPTRIWSGLDSGRRRGFVHQILRLNCRPGSCGINVCRTEQLLGNSHFTVWTLPLPHCEFQYGSTPRPSLQSPCAARTTRLWTLQEPDFLWHELPEERAAIRKLAKMNNRQNWRFGLFRVVIAI